MQKDAREAARAEIAALNRERYGANEDNEPTKKDVYPRTTEELVAEYAMLNETIAHATKRRESLDVQFQKIMDQQALAYNTVRKSAFSDGPEESPVPPRYAL